MYIFSAIFAAEFTASCFEAEGSYTPAMDPLAMDCYRRNYDCECKKEKEWQAYNFAMFTLLVEEAAGLGHRQSN